MTVRCESCNHKIVCKNKELYENLHRAISSTEFAVGNADGTVRKVMLEDIPFFNLALNCEYYK